MVKYTRKGTPVKNNSFKYGMLGEKYVHHHIQCPRCFRRLERLPPNHPGTDFCCKNGHYFQLKSKNKKGLRRKSNGISKLACGSYKHQRQTLMKPYATDFLILYYDKPKHQVNKVFWLKNEQINKRSLKKKPTIRKNYRKDDDGNKIYTNQYQYDMSEIEYNQTDCTQLKLRKLALADDYSYNKNRANVKRGRVEEYPDIIQYVDVERDDQNVDKNFREKQLEVNLSKISCNCNTFALQNGKKRCPHLNQCMINWESKKRGRYLVKGSDQKHIYLVDVNEQICSCPHFKYRREICKHLKMCIEEPKNEKILRDCRCI